MSNIKRWRQLSTKRILNHRFLAVDEDIVELPNGKKITYVLHTPTTLQSVIIIAKNELGHILLQKEFSYPPNEIMWQLPGDEIKEKESIKEAANRELSEESGFNAKNLEYIGYFYVNNRKSNRKQHIVVARNLYKHKKVADEDEFIETYWVSESDLHNMITRNEFNNINLLATLNIWFHTNSQKDLDK